MSPTARRTEIDVNCQAPGLMEARFSRSDECRGGGAVVVGQFASAGTPELAMDSPRGAGADGVVVPETPVVA